MSSVHWIETQDSFFEQYKFERFIEVGPSLTLIGMATHTLKAKYETKDNSTGHVRQVFCASKDQKEIVRNLLVVPLGYEVVLREVEDEAEENDKRQAEEEIGGNGAEDGQEVEEGEEINDCKKCRGRWRSTSSVQFTGGQSEDRPVYSWGYIYIAAVCTYVA